MLKFDFSVLNALVVEDNDFVRCLVLKHLKDFGFRNVFEAANGMEGLQLVEKQKPDIIICDIQMEPLNGFEFLKHVRAKNAAAKRLPVIFLTGNAESEYVQKALELEVSAYLLKPVIPAVLRDKIVTLMTRSLTA